MGRYYTGDIEGKFWLGVQSSDDASFFGGTTYEPSYINYSFSLEDLPEVDKGLDTCTRKLGKNKAKLDKFFKEPRGYNDEMLVEAGIAKSVAEVAGLLEWYSRLQLGLQIRKCIKENGSCDFEAEL